MVKHVPPINPDLDRMPSEGHAMSEPMTNEAIRVKALEWIEPYLFDGKRYVDTVWEPSTPIQYTLIEEAPGHWKCFGRAGTWGTLEEAKAACQADFGKRVGECVEVDAARRADTAAINSLTHEIEQRRDEMRALKARCDKLEAAAREACDQLKSLAYSSHKATRRPLSKRPRTKLLQRPEKVRDNLLAVRKALRSVLDGGE